MELVTSFKMKIVNKIRLRLAVWFVSIVMILYILGAASSLFVFQAGLTRSVDVSLTDLIAEVRPSIKLSEGTPSLKAWADRANEQGTPILATVQLFDREEKLIEEYGPEGVNKLLNGTTKAVIAGKSESLRSMYKTISESGVPSGFLQLQVYTRPRDEAVMHFAATILIIAPFLAAGVGFSAYVFSGKAVQPIEKTNLLLRRFVADAGHEFKTPVATIEACLQTMKDPSKLGDMSDEIFEMLSRSSNRLSHLATDLVALARIEDPDSELLRTSVNVRELIESVVADLSPAAKAKKIDLHVKDIPEVVIMFHEESLHEIFNNLIENAIKYSDDETDVVISAKQGGDNISISVKDSGQGIASDDLPHIFERFHRVEQSRSRDVGGSGLGLSIVKAAVDRHGGKIAVNSQVGKGSTFTVTLST